MAHDAYRKYIEVTYAGRQLLNKHKLDEYGIWHIKGEDPNCDWGGPHHQPDLGVMTGTLEEVIREAIELPNFWTWGAGGTISLAKHISPKEEVRMFLEEGIRETALAKLTDEEKEILGLL
jgi:hypothetical protein